MASNTPEGKVKAKVDAILKRHGVWYFKPVSNGMGAHGIPDFVACFKGRFIAVECKGMDTGRPTALQQIQMARIEEAGGYVFLATPATVASLDVMLEALKANLPCK